MRCAQTLEVGAYVLGALSPSERDAFERHLGECAICRDEVADLAVLPGLLGRIDAETAMAVARDGEDHSVFPDDLLSDAEAWAGPTATSRWAGPTVADDAKTGESAESQPAGWAGPTAVPDSDEEQAASAGDGKVVSLLEAAARRRSAEKRRRRLTNVVVGLVAACLAVVVGLGAPRLFDEEGPAGPAMTAMSRVAENAPVTAEVALQPVTSGTRVIMVCRYREGPGARRWDLQLMAMPRAGGPAQLVGDWSASNGDQFELTSITKLPRDEIRRLELQLADGTVLLALDL